MKVEGKIKLVGATQTFDSGFTKRQLVLTTFEQYPQDIAIDFVKDKTSLLDPLQVGESKSVSINIRGNEYNGKYYVNLQGWRVEDVAEETPAQEQPIGNEQDVPF